MNKPKISVVLPCYHVEQYLPNIHADLLAQTMNDYELIYINDGGGKILSELIQSFAAQDKRVVAIDKENGGVSSARNLGIEKARGEYIVFIDPDDRVEPYYLECLLSTVEGTDNVLGVGGFKQTYLGQGREVDYTLPKYDIEAKIADYFPTWSSFVYGCVWNKIFKTDFLRVNGIMFVPYPMREDALFMFSVYERVDTFGLVVDCGYHYLMYGNTASQRYHKGLKEINRENNKRYYGLLKKYGASDVKIEALEDKNIAFEIYWIVINAFNRNTPLSFKEKISYIQDLMKDRYWMDKLEKHNISNDKKIVKLTARLMLTYKAWLVAWVFRILFALKNNFKSLYFWYDAHFSGKFSS